MMQFVTKTKPKLSFKLSNKRQSSFSKKPLQICLFAAAATCWLSVFFNIPKIKNCKTRFSGVCHNVWPLLGWLILQFYIHAPAPKESYYNEIIAKPKIHFLCLNPFPLENIGTALKLGRNMIHVLGGLASLAVLYNHSTAIENLKTKVLCVYTFSLPYIWQHHQLLLSAEAGVLLRCRWSMTSIVPAEARILFSLHLNDETMKL